mmetsp:Transcript_13166/g.29269  ORF Transcript_13166/g.29269 Transcript_13166/m.29269 type:complete len:248 (+) Transcript_13166:251-994(+)
MSSKILMFPNLLISAWNDDFEGLPNNPCEVSQKIKLVSTARTSVGVFTRNLACTFSSHCRSRSPSTSIQGLAYFEESSCFTELSCRLKALLLTIRAISDEGIRSRAGAGSSSSITSLGAVEGGEASTISQFASGSVRNAGLLVLASLCPELPVRRRRRAGFATLATSAGSCSSSCSTSLGLGSSSLSAIRRKAEMRRVCRRSGDFFRSRAAKRVTRTVERSTELRDWANWSWRSAALWTKDRWARST